MTKQVNGIPAIRMAALVFARDGKTKRELIEFLHRGMAITKRQVLNQLRELGIAEENGRLRLPANVVPLWTGPIGWGGVSEPIEASA